MRRRCNDNDATYKVKNKTKKKHRTRSLRRPPTSRSTPLQSIWAMLFLHQGHVVLPWASMLFMHDRCSTCPHPSTASASTDPNRSSKHTGQFCLVTPGIHLWSPEVEVAKQAPHVTQWKKLARPPTRQIPHPSQWNCCLLTSSSKRRQGIQAYAPKDTWHDAQVVVWPSEPPGGCSEPHETQRSWVTTSGVHVGWSRSRDSAWASWQRRQGK